MHETRIRCYFLFSNDDDEEETQRISDAGLGDDSDDGHDLPETVLSTTTKAALDNLRQALKKVERSSNMREKLAELTKANNGKNLKVIIDVKIRWYSTISMLERAQQIMPSLNEVLRQFCHPTFSRVETDVLDEILNVLTPFKDVMKCLCRSDATLIHGDRLVYALMESLMESYSELSNLLLEVRQMMQKRRSPFASLLQYLMNPSYDSKYEMAFATPVASEVELHQMIMQLIDNDPKLYEGLAEFDSHCHYEEEERSIREKCPLARRPAVLKRSSQCRSVLKKSRPTYRFKSASVAK